MSEKTADFKDAAIADYHRSNQTYAVVAARHGISSSALHSWVNPDGVRPRRRKTWREEEIAYVGGWEVRGGVRHPLFPERRSA